MPWDTTEVYVNSNPVETTGSNGQIRINPSGAVWWIGDGLSDLYGLRGYVDGVVKRIDLPEEDLKCPSFGWSAGVRSWDFLPEGDEVVARCKNQVTGLVTLKVISLSTGSVLKTLSDLGAADVGGVSVTDDGKIVYVGGRHDSPGAVYALKPPYDKPDSREVRERGCLFILCACVCVVSSCARATARPLLTHAISSPTCTRANTQLISTPLQPTSPIIPYTPTFVEPQHITFPGSKGVVHASLYLPSKMKEGCDKPPLLVKAHGGPTSSTSTTWRLDIQYWCSRGWVVVDVDYGGSDGYGREYRERLKGEWGALDWKVREGRGGRKG